MRLRNQRDENFYKHLSRGGTQWVRDKNIRMEDGRSDRHGSIGRRYFDSTGRRYRNKYNGGTLRDRSDNLEVEKVDYRKMKEVVKEVLDMKLKEMEDKFEKIATL